MQDADFDETDALRNLIDEKDYFYVVAWDEAQKVDGAILFDFDGLHELIKDQFGLLSWRESMSDVGGAQIDFVLPPADELRLITLNQKRLDFIVEGVTPRELYRFLKALTERFPQKNKLYVVWGSIGYAWLRTDLPEEEAIIHMLSHDDAVRAELGLPEYDHSEW